MNKDDLIKFWIESADNDYGTMNHLYENRDYNWALFIGHLVIEKLLKACYVKNVENQPPFMHNLLRLSEKALLILDQDQMDTLVTITTFNIRARYDDYKSEFYKACTKEFTEVWIEKIKGFISWIKEQHLKL